MTVLSMARSFSWIALIFPLSSAAAARPVDDAVAEFRRAFRKVAEPAELAERRRAALKAIQGVDGVELARELLRAAERLDAECEPVEEDRAKVLRAGRRDKTLQSRAGVDPLYDLSDGIRKKLVSLKGAAAREHVLRVALTEPKLPFSLAVGIARQCDADLAQSLEKELQKALRRRAKVPERLLALVALEASRWLDAPLEALVLRQLEAATADVRVRAAHALASCRVAAAIEPMIERLGDEEGRSLKQIATALERLTGVSLGESRHSWRRWFEAEGAAWLDGVKPLGEGKPSQSTASDANSYYSIPLDGQRIVYVFDASKSMKAAMAGGEVSADNPSRLTAAAAELNRALAALKPTQSFGIVLFHSHAVRFDPELLTADPRSVQRAQNYVRYIEMRFGTAMYDGLDLAFLQAGRPALDRWYPSAIDTVFLLTDGRPMVPGDKGLSNDNTDRILRALQRWNPLGDVVVHSIGLGKNLPAGFLKKIAEQNGGQFVHDKGEG